MNEQPEDIRTMATQLIKEIADSSSSERVDSINLPMARSRVSALKDRLKDEGKDWKDVGISEKGAELLDNILKAHESF